jgi:hypothetical protein
MRFGGAEAVNILGTSMMFNFRDQLGALVSAYKLPAICVLPEMAAAGCLASYGTSVQQRKAPRRRQRTWLAAEPACRQATPLSASYR